MADEDLAPTEGAEALELAPDSGAEVAPENDVPEPIVNLASELGWVPKDQFRGDPEKWRPADEFIRAGRDIQQSATRELRSLREQMDRVGGVTTQLLQDKVAERDAYWQSQLDQAVEEGDTARVNQLVKARPAPVTDNAAPPAETQAWIAKNEWFNKDPLAQARAIEVTNQLKHLPIPEQLAQAERAIRREFPEHFGAPAKQPPGVQTGQSRTAAPSNRVKGFADMPAESQAIAKDMMRRNPALTLEAFAKSYWADKNNSRRVG